ncbi:putative ankyrin repeat-containing protein P16F5.05c [Cocos nucifera]|uniref:Putative ankyrin repeat-containing protein P16F5.05c n=1 Tax=Cocos nucifera TaxID=13894 RepID=A0A8K0IYM4_COCNU|nr:putative ankyrin repeat-containing protein P16F5.05c [Cocos nucifera]
MGMASDATQQPTPSEATPDQVQALLEVHPLKSLGLSFVTTSSLRHFLIQMGYKSGATWDSYNLLYLSFLSYFENKRIGISCERKAARYDDIEDVVSLYSVGVSLNSKDSQGRTALHMASANGHLDIVEYLISNGADINAANSEKNTPLHWSCLNGHIEVVKTLIQNGASLSVLNSHERTPMDEAVSRGRMEVIDAINAAVAQAELNGVSVS